MREIKFRAWTNKGMLYGDDGDAWFIGIHHNYKSLIRPDRTPNDVLADNLEDDSFVLEQFTGRHDKNNTEIYAGDIVKSKYKHAVVVRFGEGYYDEGYYRYVGFYLSNSDGVCVEDYVQLFDDDLEVIGNIHENPELLS